MTHFVMSHLLALFETQDTSLLFQTGNDTFDCLSKIRFVNSFSIASCGNNYRLIDEIGQIRSCKTAYTGEIGTLNR